MSTFFHDYLLAFTRVVLLVVFTLSVTGKVSELRAFARTITEFALLSHRFSLPVALLVVICEVATLVFIAIGGSLLPLGMVMATGLLLGFTVALATVLIRRLRTSCNCFGPTARQISPYDLCRNAGFILCSLGGHAVLTQMGTIHRSLSLVEWGVVAVSASAFAAVWLRIADVVSLFRRG